MAVSDRHERMHRPSAQADPRGVGAVHGGRRGADGSTRPKRRLVRRSRPTAASSATCSSRRVARLPPGQRLVFTMRHHEGLKLWEIASALGLAEGTVKRQLHAAVHRLRACPAGGERDDWRTGMTAAIASIRPTSSCISTTSSMRTDARASKRTSPAATAAVRRCRICTSSVVRLPPVRASMRRRRGNGRDSCDGWMRRAGSRRRGRREPSGGRRWPSRRRWCW